MTDPNQQPAAGSEESLQYMTGNFNEDEHDRAVDTEAEGGEESGIALISEHFEESESADDSLEDYEDDDFYDTYEGYDDDYDGGGDSGF